MHKEWLRCCCKFLLTPLHPLGWLCGHLPLPGTLLENTLVTRQLIGTSNFQLTLINNWNWTFVCLCPVCGGEEGEHDHRVHPLGTWQLLLLVSVLFFSAWQTFLSHLSNTQHRHLQPLAQASNELMPGWRLYTVKAYKLKITNNKYLRVSTQKLTN